MVSITSEMSAAGLGIGLGQALLSTAMRQQFEEAGAVLRLQFGTQATAVTR